ncbi:DUF4445 domain-containing protein, partial [bacterium]|nr:DUF4445 domain-containing protein [bacterium]
MTETPSLCRVRFFPNDVTVDVERGTTVLAAAQKAGVYTSSLCGGDGICGKCRVTLRSGPIQSEPTMLLDRKQVQDNVILACQATVEGDVEIEVPPDERRQGGQILGDEDARRFGRVSFANGGDAPLEPLVRRYELDAPAPTVQAPMAFHESVRHAIEAIEPDILLQTDFSVLRDLNLMSKFTALGPHTGKVTALIGQHGPAAAILHVGPGDMPVRNLGLAIDVGTTTIVVQLMDLATGQGIGSEAKYNSQMQYGEDYIRRIMYTQENHAREEMQSLLVDDINELVERLVQRAGVRQSEIASAVCAGNTAMIHFLARLDPSGIRREPYVPVANEVPPIRASQLGVRIYPRGLLYFLPSVAAYVGGDITAGVVATGMDQQEELTLLVDVGTNGEVVLGNRDWMVCCSASAGPAFEGVGVEHGMRAVRGAIERLHIGPDGQVNVHTVGDHPPRGICGSGMLDLLAEMHRVGVLSRNGTFLPENGAGRLIDAGGELAFVVVPKADSGTGADIVICQSDVRNLLRSKGAIFAAIAMLARSVGIELADIQRVYLAGGFGNFLNVPNAIALGMLPDVPADRVSFVGNSSIAGARAALCSRTVFERVRKAAASMTYVDLMTNPKYMEEFVSANF